MTQPPPKVGTISYDIREKVPSKICASMNLWPHGGHYFKHEWEAIFLAVTHGQKKRKN